MSLRPTSVLIVDEKNTFADAMRFAIDREPDLRCVGIAHGPSEAVAVTLRQQPDHCLVNLDLPGDDGLDTMRSIRQARPQVAFTVLSGRCDAEVVEGAERAGASHFLPKQASITDVLAALQAPGNGRMTLPGSMLIDLLRRREGSDGRTGVEGLTPREIDVLHGMAEGEPPKAIASGMGISVHTVRGHVKNIYWKLDAHNQLEAVAIARRRGLLATRV